MYAITVAELSALSLFETQMHNDVEWALMNAGPKRNIKHGDIGLNPSLCVEDAKLLEATEKDNKEAFAWIRMLVL